MLKYYTIFTVYGQNSAKQNAISYKSSALENCDVIACDLSFMGCKICPAPKVDAEVLVPYKRSVYLYQGSPIIRLYYSMSVFRPSANNHFIIHLALVLSNYWRV